MRLIIFSLCIIAFILADTVNDVADYECFKKAAIKMNEKSCPEVNNAVNYGYGKEEMMRLQVACYKKFYQNENCNVYEWERICHKMIEALPEKQNGKDTLDSARKYCSA